MKESSNELLRMRAVLNVFEVTRNCMNTPHLSEKIRKLNALLVANEPFTDVMDKQIRQTVLECKDYVPGLAITQSERIQIHQAMGSSLGHWFKCPNGHLYYIGECGGAMERGKCPDCNATVGGQSHALDPGNTRTSVIDDSRGSAWPTMR